jgi:antibiotic biosynthesis monooxygenase (ABM) superfamily enzyme
VIEYEVTIRVDPSILRDYVHWLRDHIDSMLAVPGFIDAQAFEVERTSDTDDWPRLCVRYRLHDLLALDQYVREHASSMRADAVARFGTAFEASRRVLVPVEWPH